MSDERSIVDEQKVIGAQTAPTETKAAKKQKEAIKDYSRQKGNDQLGISVKVHSPFHDYYDGQAFSVSAENTTGPFDILPKHHNFISLLKPCDLLIRTSKDSEQKIRISGGIMHVKADKVTVFLDV